MKELIFVRHAKSDWGTESLKDIDRHLSERGYSDAYFVSEWYSNNKANPGLIITSPALRAISTALLFARTINLNMDHFRIEKSLYEISSAKLLEFIREQDNKVESMMLFGHNPTFTNICNELSDELFFDNVPTCGIVSFNYDVNKWKDIENKKGKVNYHQFPKNFKNHD